MNEITYHPLYIKDLDAVQELYQEAIAQLDDPLGAVRVNPKQLAHTMRQMRQNLMAEQRYIAYVAQHEGALVAYAAALIDTQASLFAVNMYASINEIYVAQPYRQKGIGTQLLRLLESQIRERGITWLCVQLAGNARGLEKFFNKLTFQVQAVEMRKSIT